MTLLIRNVTFGIPGGSEVKKLPVNAGDMGSISGSGRSTDEENDNPLKYSCIGNPWTEESD